MPFIFISWSQIEIGRNDNFRLTLQVGYIPYLFNFYQKYMISIWGAKSTMYSLTYEMVIYFKHFFLG
jgi:hypothetical protein